MIVFIRNCAYINVMTLENNLKKAGAVLLTLATIETTNADGLITGLKETMPVFETTQTTETTSDPVVNALQGIYDATKRLDPYNGLDPFHTKKSKNLGFESCYTTIQNESIEDAINSLNKTYGCEAFEKKFRSKTDEFFENELYSTMFRNYVRTEYNKKRKGFKTDEQFCNYVDKKTAIFFQYYADGNIDDGKISEILQKMPYMTPENLEKSLRN